MSIIYKTTNLINGKIYVGQHKTSVDDGYLGSGKWIKRSIEKYSKENFIRETLEYCTSTNVNEKEIYWVNKLNATNPEIGYNIHIGGTGGKTYERTQKHKDYLQQLYTIKYIGTNNPNYGNKWNDKQKEILRQKNLGKKLSDETKIKISLWNQINGNPFKGKQHSKELKEKWSQKRKGTRLSEKNSFYGRNHSKKSKQLIGQSSKQRTKYIYFFISPQGQKYDNIINLQDFCNLIGWRQNNLKFIINEWTNYKNWKIKRVYKEKN